MRVLGMRGKFSPMLRATPEQVQAIHERIAYLKESGDFHVAEVRYPAYIGGNCAATRGAITVIVDGRIHANVEKDGTLT